MAVAEFVQATSNGPSGVPGRIVGQELGIDRANLVGTRTGGNHHGLEAFELGNGLFGQIDGHGTISGTPGRLTAARLPGWHHDIAPGRLQETQGGKPDRWPHQIDEAGNVERYTHANIAPHKKKSG